MTDAQLTPATAPTNNSAASIFNQNPPALIFLQIYLRRASAYDN
jgi:hypothetical protein